MSTQINQTDFQFGTVTARHFSEHCVPGDWETCPIIFPKPFDEKTPRVIVTANNENVDKGAHNAAVVGIAQKVTPTGFVLAARNSDCARGFAGFNWTAVLETPGEQKEKPVNLRMGVLQPKKFQSDCTAGDWNSWGVNFSTKLEKCVALLTASNLNVKPWHQDDTLWYHNPAVVGIVQDLTPTGFTLAARNSDCAEGYCTFYYVALSQINAGKADLWVDTGEEIAQHFGPDCKSGDWKGWTISFSEPFLTPPVVLVTANDLKVQGHNAAVVGIAQDVTPNGFTLSARNSDCASGQAGFYWVAIGWVMDC